MIRRNMRRARGNTPSLTNLVYRPAASFTFPTPTSPTNTIVITFDQQMVWRSGVLPHWVVSDSNGANTITGFQLLPGQQAQLTLSGNVSGLTTITVPATETELRSVAGQYLGGGVFQSSQPTYAPYPTSCWHLDGNLIDATGRSPLTASSAITYGAGKFGQCVTVGGAHGVAFGGPAAPLLSTPAALIFWFNGPVVGSGTFNTLQVALVDDGSGLGATMNVTIQLQPGHAYVNITWPDGTSGLSFDAAPATWHQLALLFNRPAPGPNRWQNFLDNTVGPSHNGNQPGDFSHSIPLFDLGSGPFTAIDDLVWLIGGTLSTTQLTGLYNSNAPYPA